MTDSSWENLFQIIRLEYSRKWIAPREILKFTMQALTLPIENTEASVEATQTIHPKIPKIPYAYSPCNSLTVART